jgi:hypothetical protein
MVAGLKRDALNIPHAFFNVIGFTVSVFSNTNSLRSNNNARSHVLAGTRVKAGVLLCATGEKIYM